MRPRRARRTDDPRGGAAAPTGVGFEWWAPHDRALRRARALFVLAALTAAVYVVAPFTVLLLAWRDEVHFDAHVVFVIAGAVVIVVAVFSTVIAVVAWRGLPRSTIARAGARPATADEGRVVATALDGVALARGIAAPTIWVVDDAAPNALVAGRGGRARFCLTSGALALRHDELEALCAFGLTALDSLPFAYCCAAIDIVPFARLLVRVRGDGRRVVSRWSIAHLWFDRDEVEPGAAALARPRLRAVVRLLWSSFTSGAPELARRCERASRDAVERRSARVRHLSAGDR